MKPLSAHKFLSVSGYFGLSEKKKAKSVFGFENPFSNFSPGKTYPLQLFFDAGIRTA